MVQLAQGLWNRVRFHRWWSDHLYWITYYIVVSVLLKTLHENRPYFSPPPSWTIFKHLFRSLIVGYVTKLNSRCRQQIADMYELKKHLRIEYSIQFIIFGTYFRIYIWNLVISRIFILSQGGGRNLIFFLITAWNLK